MRRTPEASDLYLSEVEPALQDLQEDIAENRYVKQLRRQAVTNIQEMLKTGAVLTFGLMGLADAPAVASVVVGAGAPAIGAAVRARAEQDRQRQAIERDRLFFLYETQRVLEG